MTNLSSPVTPRRWVSIGSSVANGYGATANNGWIQQLSALLVARGTGWAPYINAAVNGEGSGTQLARFVPSVLANHPQVVMISPSPGVDGLQGAGDPEAVINTLVANTKEMVRLCREAGSIPIIAIGYPRSTVGGNTGWSATDWPWVLDCNVLLMQLGAQTMDFTSLTDPGTNGWWVPALTTDGIHPNDAGHAALYALASPSFMEGCSTNPVLIPKPVFGNRPVMLVDDLSGGSGLPMAIRCVTGADYDKYPKSCCLSFRHIQPVMSSVSKRLANLNFDSDAIVRLATDGTGIVLLRNTAGTLVTSTENVVTSRRWRHFMVDYNHITGRIYLFVDGVPVNYGTVATGMRLTIAAVGASSDFAAAAEGSAFADITLHHSSMAQYALPMAQGVHHPANCTFFSPYRAITGAVSPNAKLVPNHAPSTVRGTMAYCSANYMSTVTFG